MRMKFLVNLSNIVPCFLWPVYECDDELYFSTDEDNRIISFNKIEDFDTLLIKIPINDEKEYSIGSDSCFAFSFTQDNIIYGTQDEFKKEVLTLFSTGKIDIDKLQLYYLLKALNENQLAKNVLEECKGKYTAPINGLIEKELNDENLSKIEEPDKSSKNPRKTKRKNPIRVRINELGTVVIQSVGDSSSDIVIIGPKLERVTNAKIVHEVRNLIAKYPHNQKIGHISRFFLHNLNNDDLIIKAEKIIEPFPVRKKTRPIPKTTHKMAYGFLYSKKRKSLAEEYALKKKMNQVKKSKRNIDSKS